MFCASLGAGRLDLSRVLSCSLSLVLGTALFGASVSHGSIQTPGSLETVPACLGVGLRGTVHFPHLHTNISCVILNRLPLFPMGFLICKVAIVMAVVISQACKPLAQCLAGSKCLVNICYCFSYLLE